MSKKSQHDNNADQADVVIEDHFYEVLHEMGKKISWSSMRMMCLDELH